jgi:hypothetical protein
MPSSPFDRRQNLKDMCLNPNKNVVTHTISQIHQVKKILYEAKKSPKKPGLKKKSKLIYKKKRRLSS